MIRVREYDGFWIVWRDENIILETPNESEAILFALAIGWQS